MGRLSCARAGKVDLPGFRHLCTSRRGTARAGPRPSPAQQQEPGPAGTAAEENEEKGGTSARDWPNTLIFCYYISGTRWLLSCLPSDTVLLYCTSEYTKNFTVDNS